MDLNRRQFLVKTSSSLMAGWALANGLRPGNGIYLASASGAYSLITGTAGMTYPTWYPDGATLAVYNNLPKTGEPVPRTSKMDLSGKILQDVLANNNTWAGFASLNQTSPSLIAFAGQVVKTGTTYNQDKNYIWLTNTPATQPTVRTLAPGAPTNKFDPNYQGRAPWYSPDGKWTVFESNRFNSSGLYSIFIQIADGSSTAVRVTNPGWDAQHAKFYPNGTELVVTVLQTFGGKSTSKRGIAKLDVSAFVNRTP